MHFQEANPGISVQRLLLQPAAASSMLLNQIKVFYYYHRSDLQSQGSTDVGEELQEGIKFETSSSTCKKVTFMNLKWL